MEELLEAARSGSLDVRTVVDVNAQLRGGLSLLWVAAESGQTAVVDALLDCQADVDLRHETGVTPSADIKLLFIFGPSVSSVKS